MNQHDNTVADRRNFLRAGAQLAGTAVVAAPLQALLARAAAGATVRFDYGELMPTNDAATGLPLLKLPSGFSYLSFGWTGDPLTDGTPTPQAHDGMAVVDAIGSRIVLIRNHERTGVGNAFGEEAVTYDPYAPAGTTTLIFNSATGELEKSWASLSGTLRNCAGGPTPWKSWLSCEETVAGPENGGRLPNQETMQYEREHGWIFEVPANRRAKPVALRDMGRFVHEAVAVDPVTKVVYETEDRSPAGFYRFLPNRPGQLERGGRLEMLKVPGRVSMIRRVPADATFDVEWVPIEDPTRAHAPGTRDEGGVFAQGKEQGASSFKRLEGCWYHGGLIYFVSTDGGDAGMGQVWSYDPKAERLRLVFESPGAEVLNYPDNLTASPRGGLLICEDGDGATQRLHGLTVDGRIFPFAENHIRLDGRRNGISGDFRDQEWAGASFSTDGKWLFVNIQSPGITFAITGPWQSGSL